MANVIPLIDSQQTTRVGGIDVYSNPDQMGAGIGRAIEGLGRSIGSMAASFRAKDEKQKNLDRAERLATSSAAGEIELGKISTDVQLGAPADGKGTMDQTLLKQQQYIDETVNKVDDPIERQALKIELTNRLPRYALNNLEFETARNLKNQEDVTNFTLNGLENRVRSDASSHDISLADGNKIIDAQQIPAGAKDEMKRVWTQRMANSRFQGLLEDAKTADEFDIIKKELEAKDSKWRSAFTPQEFDRTLNEIGQAKKAFVTLADEQARAAITSAEARSADLVRIDPAELSQLQSMAETSQNPITLKRIMRVQRDQQILEKSSKLPSSELGARAAEIKNGGYPGMPDEINTAIQQTTAVFPGVSASYLGGTVINEYGKYLPKGGTRKGNSKFAPIAVGQNVDTRLMQPKALNATMLAGEIYGEPLQLISGHRSQEQQDNIRLTRGDPNRVTVARHSHHTTGDAIDANTVGMNEIQKAKLVDALLQAGFTGIGEYDTHIHADMREKTPGTFNGETGYLGWTKGSPEVVQAMLARGYGPGISGSKLSRGNAAQAATEKVDYGRSADGNPSSATGIGQHVDKTWLQIMKDPKIAQRIGLPKGLTDAQLLELRKDPHWSMMGIGAYAEQNQKILTNTLGRPANDAELRMAHFLGPTGAQRLISAYKNSPDAIAADAMPEAAKNNPPRFYADGGKGKPLTFKQVYDGIALSMETAPSQVQYEDAQTYDRMATASRKAEKDDPMTHYANSVAPVNDLNVEGGYAARGATAGAAAGLYSIPIEEMKPFTADEAADLTKRIAEGNSEQKLEIMRQIESMDQAKPGLGKAAYAQIGQKDTAVAHAAALANERNDPTTAEMIIRGQQRLKDDKQLETSLFGKAADVNDTFNEATGGALFSLPPASRNAIFDAAKALYAEKQAQAGKFEFDPETFKSAVVQAVGGNASTAGMAEVNGRMTVLPPGVSGETFDTAINKLTDSDLIKFSRDGNPPITIEGDTISAADVAREGEFVFIGDSMYTIRMNDGQTLTTGEHLSNGNLRAFVFDAKPDELTKLASRPEPAVSAADPKDGPAPVNVITGAELKPEDMIVFGSVVKRGKPPLTPAQKAIENTPEWQGAQ